MCGYRDELGETKYLFQDVTGDRVRVKRHSTESVGFGNRFLYLLFLLLLIYFLFFLCINGIHKEIGPNGINKIR